MLTTSLLSLALPCLYAVLHCDGDEPVSALRYYAYPARHDAHGVIAPWYLGQNGQCDFRVRIAAETLKRYPWATQQEAVVAAPHYVFNGSWRTSEDGSITIPPIDDWANGDLGQRAAYVLSGLVDYYRYSGDAAAISHLYLTADYLLQYCQTGPDHAWPRMLISVPGRGKAYGQADPHGFIQLDIVAEVGLGLLRAYQITGLRRWFEAACHWGDLFAQKRNRQPGVPPWGRYANPEDALWPDHQTGGVAFVLYFLNELIRLGYAGEGNAIVEARDAGEAYLRDHLLPRWTVDDVWGRNYWDWENPVQAENVTEFVVRYMMERPHAFPNWRTDCRNIMSLFLNRTGVSPFSNGDVYSGAWAYPESSSCCDRSLWYGPMELATVWAEYSVRAGCEWAREIARRKIILATYDCHETGVVEDNIDGGQIVAGAWFKIAHPMALKHALGTMAWLPETLGPSRENHIMRSSSVVRNVQYGAGRVEYVTYDAPTPTVDVLRLAFEPTSVRAGDEILPRRDALDANGFTVVPLPDGDCIVTVRHDGLRHVRIEGPDPQKEIGVDEGTLAFTGNWSAIPASGDATRACRVSSAAGAEMMVRFTGNQVRLIGRVGPSGGLADVFLDGQQQLVGVDTWCPLSRSGQVLYYRNGLPNGEHTLRLVVRGEGNPRSRGARVAVEAVQFSAAVGVPRWGEGGGPTGPQRVIFGYPGRQDYVDSSGNSWRPATEWVARTGHGADVVKLNWWTERRRMHIANTPDPELYRYGAHAPMLTHHFTVGPGTYWVRIKLAETRSVIPDQRVMTISINGEEKVKALDVVATAGGMNRAVDLVFPGIVPKAGVISVQLRGTYGGEAMVQAMEIGTGEAPAGAEPVCWTAPSAAAGNLLANPGFEASLEGRVGRLGETMEVAGWKYLFASPSQCYIWAEADYSIHPEWGLPEFHSGGQALRTHTDGNGHTLIMQEVPVLPSTPYRASVWVRAVDLRGKGFGTSGGDSAGLCIHEIGPCGKVLVDHPKVAVTEAGPYVELAHEFTTSEKTVRVRFILDTVIGCKYDEGHVTYDDCALIALAEQ